MHTRIVFVQHFVDQSENYYSPLPEMRSRKFVCSRCRLTSTAILFTFFRTLQPGTEARSHRLFVCWKLNLLCTHAWMHVARTHELDRPLLFLYCYSIRHHLDATARAMQWQRKKKKTERQLFCCAVRCAPAAATSKREFMMRHVLGIHIENALGTARPRVTVASTADFALSFVEKRTNRRNARIKLRIEMARNCFPMYLSLLSMTVWSHSNFSEYNFHSTTTILSTDSCMSRCAANVFHHKNLLLVLLLIVFIASS